MDKPKWISIESQLCPPNFTGKDKKLYLVRCFNCGGETGRENYAPAVATGVCAFCGWDREKAK